MLVILMWWLGIRLMHLLHLVERTFFSSMKHFIQGSWASCQDWPFPNLSQSVIIILLRLSCFRLWACSWFHPDYQNTAVSIVITNTCQCIHIFYCQGCLVTKYMYLWHCMFMFYVKVSVCGIEGVDHPITVMQMYTEMGQNVLLVIV